MENEKEKRETEENVETNKNNENLKKDDKKELIDNNIKDEKTEIIEEQTKEEIHEDKKIVSETKEDETKEIQSNATDLVKNEDIQIDEKKLNKINEAIKENKKNGRNNKVKNEKYVRILRNVVIAVIGIAYISITLMGAKRIPAEQYQLDLKVFIILSAITGVLLFEKAFRTDKFKFALAGIEILVLGIATVILLHLYKLQNSNLLKYSKYFVLLWILYYIIKCIIIAVKRVETDEKESENN